MNTKNKKVVAVVLIAMLAVVPTARAVLGVGDITFDPTNYAQAIKTFLQLQQQYRQLVQLYQQARQQYDHLRRMAQTVPVNMQARYRAAVTPWKNSSAANTYGTTSDWVRSMKSGENAESGYANSVQPFSSYGSALSSLPANRGIQVDE